MSALENTPLNQNFQSPQAFKFFLRRAPTLNFFIQKTAVPEISLEPTSQPTPFTVIPLPGDHIDYMPYQLTFKVDEDLKNYLEIHDWLRSLGFPERYDEYVMKTNRPRTDLTGLTSDIQLLLLTSSENPSHSINFVDAHPVHLSALEFNTTDTTINFLEATVIFKYTNFYIESII